MEIPVLPVNAVAGDGVVLALGLDDLQRLDRRTLAPAPVIRRRLHRHRDKRFVFDLDEFLLLQIDNRHQAFDRMRPIVAVIGIEVADDLQQALVLGQAVLAVEVADGQRCGHDLFNIVDAALGQGLCVLRAGLDGRLHRGEIVQQHHAMGAFNRFPGLQFLAVEIDQRFDHVLAVQHHDIGLAWLIDLLPGVDEVPHLIFRRLLDRDFGEAKTGLVMLGLLDDVHRRGDFVRAQGIERVRAGFDDKGLVQAGLEHLVDEVLGHEGGLALEHHRHRQRHGLAVEHGHFAVRLDLEVDPVLGNGEQVGIVVPFDRGAKLLEARLQRHHFGVTAVGLGIACPIRQAEGAQGDRQGEPGKRFSVSQRKGGEHSGFLRKSR